MMTYSVCSLCLLYKVHAIELDLQSQLHQFVLFSHYSSTELSKEREFLVEILQLAFQGLAPSRCHPCFHAQQSNTQNVFWEPGDDHNDHNEPLKMKFLVFTQRCACSLTITFACFFCIHFIALSIILQSLSLFIFTKISWSTINSRPKMALGL